jgi:hypothetical protein
MSNQKSKFEGLFEPQAEQPAQPVEEQETNKEFLKSRNKEIKKRRIQESPVPRIKTNYEIRQDYVQTIKRIAVFEQRKIYEVIEEAIAEYLKRHQESKA